MRVSVVVALEHCDENIPELLDVLGSHCAVHELIFVGHSKPVADAEDCARWLPSASTDRIPHMWRDGILAARSDWVALLSGHCVPDLQWLNELEDLQPGESVVGIGGSISCLHASNVSQAVHWLRYARFSDDEGEVADIPADNALYRRADILACDDLLAEGFWEPAFHQRFLSSGKRLVASPGLRTVLRNRYSAVEFSGQRFSHGFQFGFDRGAGMSLASRLLWIFVLPAVPFVLLAKIFFKGFRSARYSPGSLCFLVLFTFCWGGGEILGHLRSIFAGSPKHE